mgnify:CR=1 FL=1
MEGKELTQSIRKSQTYAKNIIILVNNVNEYEVNVTGSYFKNLVSLEKYFWSKTANGQREFISW